METNSAGAQNPRLGQDLNPGFHLSVVRVEEQGSVHRRNMENGAISGGGGSSFSPGHARALESPHLSNCLYLHPLFAKLFTSLTALPFPHSPTRLSPFSKGRTRLREFQWLPTGTHTEEEAEHLIPRPGTESLPPPEEGHQPRQTGIAVWMKSG